MKKLVLFSIFCFFIFVSHSYAQSPFDKGLEELKNENYEEALEYFLQAYKLEPKSSKIAFYVGLSYKLIGEPKKSIPYLKEALTLTPKVKEALVELIDALYATDNLEEAKEWIAFGEKEMIDPAKVQFLKGLVLSKQRNYKEAISAFEKAKSLDPTISQACELQIGLASAREGRLKEAKERFRAAISLDPTTDIASYAKDYERLIEEKIKAEKPWRFSLSLNYKYDSNVVTKGTGPIVEAISGQSDSALNLNFQIAYTFPFSFRTPYELSLKYSLFAERYFPKVYTRADGSKGNLSEYNNMSNSFSAVFGRTFKNWSLSLPITYTYNSLQGEKSNTFLDELNWWNTTRYMEHLAVTPTLRYQLDKNVVGEVLVGLGTKRYFKTHLHPEPIDPEEIRDADIISLGFGIIRLLQDGKGIFSLRYAFGKEEAKGRYWSIEAQNRLSLALLYPLKPIIKRPVKFLFSGEASFERYKFVHAVFDKKRRDDIYNVSGSLIYEGFLADIFSAPRFKNLDLLFQYSHIRDKSNIPIYDYRRNIISAGIEYKF